VSKGTVTLIPSAGGPVLSSVADENGLFHFNNLVFTDTARFVLSAVKANGANSTKITWFPDKVLPVSAVSRSGSEGSDQGVAMSVYLKNAGEERNEVINYGRGKGIMLKEVKISEKKPDDQYHTESLAGAGHADQVMHADEIEKVQGPLSTSLNGRLRGVVFGGVQLHRVPFLTTIGLGEPMLLIIDGAEAPPDDIDLLSANDVETVEVLKYSSASIYGMNGGNGVLVITTKRGGGANVKDIASIGVLPIAPIGFYKAREFYSPKYEHTDSGYKEKDLRSTIYWNPELKTDKDGNVAFDYYNADGTGTYKVVIEGIDEDGILGRQVYRYKVE
jgi:TonB-dependent SusC/RagA subfamily outer membrane receptor